MRAYLCEHKYPHSRQNIEYYSIFAKKVPKICVCAIFVVNLQAELKFMPSETYIARLSPYLFWDMDRQRVDAERNSRHLIQRVLEYGNLDDWRLTRDYYGMNRVVSECQQLRSLNPKSLAFICAVSDTKKEDYRCYHFRQSFPTLWNS